MVVKISTIQSTTFSFSKLWNIFTENCTDREELIWGPVSIQLNEMQGIVLSHYFLQVIGKKHYNLE